MIAIVPALMISALSLRPLWTYHATRWITSTPTVEGGLVYAGVWSGDVVALDAKTGHVRWSAELGANPDAIYGQPRGVTSSIAVSDGVAYAVSGSCRAGAFDARTGVTIWKRTVCSIARNDDPYATPVVANGLVLLGIAILGDRPTDRGSLLALDARTGATRWQLFPERYRGTGTGISATPIIDTARDIGYVGTGNPTPITSPPPGPDAYSESILAFDLNTGKIVWAFGPVHPHDVHDNDLFASPNRFTIGTREIIGEGGKDGIYYAVDARSGRLVWRTAVDPGDPYASMIGATAYADGRIFAPLFANARGALVAVSARDGAIVWSRKLGGVYEGPAIWHDVVFDVDTKGTLVAFDAASGHRLLTTHVAGRSYGRGPRVDGSTLYVTAGSTLTAYAIR
jgi:polyvinyl alcohol dehydrogenase (cytochrome)